MKKYLLPIILFLFSVTVYSQTDPVAVDDYAASLSQQTIEIDVMINDYDPDGDEFIIQTVKNPEHGEVIYNDSLVYYTSDPGHSGIDSMRYRIEDTEGDRSEYAWIYITVDENPNVPEAENDQGSVLQLVPTEIDVLANDSDPNGDELIIYALSKQLPYNHYDVSISEDSTKVILTSAYPLGIYYANFKYKIKEKNTAGGYISDWATVHIDIVTNPDLPTAIEDEANVVGGESVNIFVLNNDNDPTGTGLEIYEVGNPGMGTVEIEGDHLLYTANTSAQGIDQFSYKSRNIDQPYLWSSSSVSVSIAPNPGLPVAVDDYTTGICGVDVLINALDNDYDPDGAAIEIMDAQLIDIPSPLMSLEIVDNALLLTAVGDIVINVAAIELKYRIREVNDTNSFSDWGRIYISMTLNEDYPILANDFAETIAGVPMEIDIFANDDFNGHEVGMFVHTSGPTNHGQGLLVDNVYSFTSYMSSVSDTAHIKYNILKLSYPNPYLVTGNIDIAITSNHSYDSLDINNINAGIRSDGHLFNNYNEIIDYGADDFASHFEYPKGSGHHTIFMQSFWLGGLDASNQLHLAAQQFKQNGYDFQFGPVADDYSGIDYFSLYSRVWKLSKEQVNFHVDNYWKESYDPIPEIEYWPGNGNVANGEAAQLAPYFDSDANGYYDPMAGDYPLIRGDQCILFIFNDDRIHTETNGEALKVELHGMAYAFDNPGDSLFKNTVFLHYDIYNRSSNTYSNTYFGMWTDFDIGYAWDDYVGSNVELGSYYGYNGTEFDGSGEPWSYGENPPVQSVTVVAGPFLDADGEDNPDGECDYSINGLNFGDGVADNERFGLTRFTFHDNHSGANGNPNIAPEYYYYLRGLWKDGTPVLFGGNGHLNSGAVGPECKFMFPDDSDECNWGTAGSLPNGGYNQGGKYWTEAETGNNPSDRRGLGVSGPFTFEPGDRQEVELAFSVGRGTDGPASGMAELFNNLTNLFNLVNQGEIIIPADELSVSDTEVVETEIGIYPNPARERIYVSIKGIENTSVQYCIYDNLGTMVAQGYFTPSGVQEININGLKSGFYVIKVIGDVSGTAKFIKL